MKIPIRFKKLGEKKYSSATIELNDFDMELSNFDCDVIEYTKENKLGIFFFEKKDLQNDFFCYTIRRINKKEHFNNEIKEAFTQFRKYRDKPKDQYQQILLFD